MPTVQLEALRFKPVPSESHGEVFIKDRCTVDFAETWTLLRQRALLISQKQEAHMF